MLKFFRKSDIVNTDFTVSTDKTADNIVGDLLAGTDSSGSVFSINILGEECDDSKSGSCNPNTFLSAVKTSPSELDISHQYGKYVHSSSVFYDVDDSSYNSGSNPVNKDGSYKRQVFNSVENMYYNDYNNAYNIFGFDGFDTSNTSLNLSNEFVLLNLKTTDSGDRLRATSVVVKNQSGDIVANLIDDGYHNLQLSGTYFIHKHTFKANTKDNVFSYGDCGVSQLINGNVILPVAPTPTPTPTPTTYYYATFTSCDTSGSLLYISSSNIITGSSVLYDSGSDRCFSFYITGGDGRNGNISDYVGYSSCSACETANTPTTRYHFLFESCDTSGSLLEVWSGSLISEDLTLYSLENNRCYVSKSFGGDGSDGNISTFTASYTSCSACEVEHPSPVRHHRLFIACNGDGSTLKLKSNIGTIPNGLTIYEQSSNKCYVYSGVGGDGSDGDISNYPTYGSCGDCEVSGAIVPSITPPISVDPVVIQGDNPDLQPPNSPEIGGLVPTGCTNNVRVQHEILANTAPGTTLLINIKSLLINSDPDKNPSGRCEDTVFISGLGYSKELYTQETCAQDPTNKGVTVGYIIMTDLALPNSGWSPSNSQDIANFATFTYTQYWWKTEGTNQIWCDDPTTKPVASNPWVITYTLGQFLELINYNSDTGEYFIRTPS